MILSLFPRLVALGLYLLFSGFLSAASDYPDDPPEYTEPYPEKKASLVSTPSAPMEDEFSQDPILAELMRERDAALRRTQEAEKKAARQTRLMELVLERDAALRMAQEAEKKADSQTLFREESSLNSLINTQPTLQSPQSSAPPFNPDFHEQTFPHRSTSQHISPNTQDESSPLIRNQSRRTEDQSQTHSTNSNNHSTTCCADCCSCTLSACKTCCNACLSCCESITTGEPCNPFGCFSAKGPTYHGTPTACESANCLCDCIPRSDAYNRSHCYPAFYCPFMAVECLWTASLLPAAVAWRTITAPWQRSIYCCDTLIARAWACTHPCTYDPVFHVACGCNSGGGGSCRAGDVLLSVLTCGIITLVRGCDDSCSF